MQQVLRRMRQKRAAGDSGFTLVELLVVVVIIGVLVAIAVPMYLSYRKGAANKSAESDVRAAVSAVEQYYTENNNTYPGDGQNTLGVVKFVLNATTSGDTGSGTATSIPQNANLSPGNTMQLKNNTNTYRICAMNVDGKVIYIYDSALGGSVAKAKNQGDLATCIASG